MVIQLRKWLPENKEELMRICNGADRTYLANRMPYPYTEKDAEWWLGMVREQDGKSGIFRAIVVDGEYAGNISVETLNDVYYRDCEIGYFLLEGHRSKGIVTEAVVQTCRIAFSELDIIRITGLVYEPNKASARVLEKNGFELEGMKKNAVTKGEHVYHLYIFGKCK